MAEPIQKISAEQLAQMGVVAAPDKLTGNPKDNKMIFDRLIREVVAVAVNTAIDVLNEMIPAETDRENAEDERVNAEKMRVQAEAERVRTEKAREHAEWTRAENEAARVAAEDVRELAEQARVNTNNGIVAQATEQAERAEMGANNAASHMSRAAAEASAARKQADRAEELADNIGAHGEEVSATLLADGWSGSGPYVQTVSVPGVNGNSFGNIGIPMSATDEQRNAMKAASMFLSAVDTDSVTITAEGTKPTIDLPLIVQFGMVVEGGSGGGTGLSATFEIVGTETIEPGQAAYATETEESTPQARKYILSIPRGQTGSIGPRGYQGVPGLDGEDGFSPEFSSEEINGGYILHVTTAAGSISFPVYHGSIGPQGPTGPKGETGPIGPQGPQGEKGDHGPALAVTNTAAVGQTVKITAVDEDGQPTAWEAADMESVDAAYELAATIEITESVSSITQEFGKAYNELYIFFDGVASSASCQIGINKLLSENNWLTTATGYKAARLIHRPGICIERQDSNPATYGFWQGANVTRRFDFSKDSDFESVVIYTSNPSTATINSGTIKIYGR
jgi:hypothetical protein